MKNFFANKFKTAVHRVNNERSGFTLIELIVATAVSTIVMSGVIVIFFLTIKSYTSGTENSTAQNLAVLTLQKVESTVRYSDVSITNTESGYGIYYDSANNGIHICSDTYQENSFKGYKCTFTFTKDLTSRKNNLLDIKIDISDSHGNPLFSTSGSVYLLNGTVDDTSPGTVGAGNSGKALGL